MKNWLSVCLHNFSFHCLLEIEISISYKCCSTDYNNYYKKHFFLAIEFFLHFLLTHNIFDTFWKFEQNLSTGFKNIRFLVKLWFSHTVYPKMHILPINKKPNVWHKNYLTSNYLQDLLYIQLECWLQEISKNFVKIYRNWLFFLKTIHILLEFLC